MTTAVRPVRRLRVTWRAALDPTSPQFTDEVVLEDGPDDQRRLQKLLSQRHLHVASFADEVDILTVTPLDLVAALVLLVGLPGSGKTTWARARFHRTQIVCLDDLREKLTGDAADQSANPQASTIQKILVGGRLSRRLLTVVDGTNAEPVHRHPLIKLARQADMPIVVVHFMATAEECLANMAGRDRQVDEADVRRIDEQIRSGFVDLVGSTDAMMTVDRDGTTVKINGPWRDIAHFGQWRAELDARAVAEVARGERAAA